MQEKKIDWQGHRGARGLVPENTIPSFLKALTFPISTLELDVVVSKDRQLIVSHEPWMSPHICNSPDGTPVQETTEKINLYQLTYQEIQTYDCGSRGNARFEQQVPMSAFKPSLKDMVKAVEKYCQHHQRTLPNYNIEIKTSEEFYGVFTPEPTDFVNLAIAELYALNIQKRCNLQSFDLAILEAIRAKDVTIPVAYLVEKGDLEENLKKLSFQPNIYSPYHVLVTLQTVEKVHAKGMKIIPWTVNEKARVKKLIDIGVDGIITDYPNFSEELTT